MRRLKCPDCGRSPKEHPRNFCGLGLEECFAAAMMFETMRAKACAHLKALGACIDYGAGKRDWRVLRVYEAIAAYRAVGLLPMPKERE